MKPTLPIALFVVLTVLLLFGASLQAQMLADIQQDVQTEFGVYHPYVVTITPKAEPYTVAPDFSNVVNFSRFTFDETEKALLAQNYFVVTPRRTSGGTGYKEMYDIYNEAREQGIPIFVTTDALLHTFHLTFDTILRIIEQKKFIGDLNALLLGLLDETQRQYAAASDTVARKALFKNLNYLIVAETLLDSTYVPPIGQGPHLEELRLIREHQGFAVPPILGVPGYREDYSQYIPRGHYTRSDSLKRYFLSMMWLGRMTFAAEVPARCLSAALLIQAIERAQVQGEPALSVWERIYQPTVFFVGKSDDLTLYQYMPLVRQVYGENFAQLSPDAFADPVKLDAFATLVNQLPNPRIDYEGQVKGFRLMGQRFIPDSYMFTELVWPKVDNPPRFMPRGLDVMAILGSIRAYQLLDQVYHETANADYVRQISKLKAEFAAYPDSVWAQNVYWNWLYSLMPLLFPKGEGYPPFLQTLAWLDKELYAALGSWAELRHDTILYAKQSGSRTSAPPPSLLVQGYVEPNPYLFARLASLAEFMITGLESKGLLFEDFEVHLRTFRDLSLALKAIAEKELTNQSLTGEEYTLIANIGETLESIAEFKRYHDGPTPESEPMPVVADVHTDANYGEVLEVGVGHPFSVYVICNVEGQLVVTKGAGFSYYEFHWPMNDRLTDEKWREMLKRENVPGMPEWVASFMDVGQAWVNSDPQFYWWQKRGLQKLLIRVEPDSVEVGHEVTIRASMEPFIVGSPVIFRIFTPSGDTISQTVLIDTSGSAVVTLDSLREVGRYWVEGTALGLIYRSRFEVYRASLVDNHPSEIPSRFALYPNHPNPFNATTVIRYDVPAAGFVTLEIYNLLGQKVRTLVNERKAAGSYQARWDGYDDAGHALPSGMYLYRLEAESFVKVRKVLLIR